MRKNKKGKHHEHYSLSWGKRRQRSGIGSGCPGAGQLDASARSFRTGKKKTIGFVVPDISSKFFGLLAQSALDAGGTVTGVEPQFFIQQELQHDGLTELIVTRDMAERKTKMIELGDAFIAFPGGTGTLEEIAEVMSRVSLGQLDAPCILYDLNGYYDSLKALLDKMIEKGLSTPQRQRGIRFAANLEEITTILNKA